MAIVDKYLLGSQATLITTGGAAANNTLCKGSAWDNTQGATGDGYTLCDLEFVGTYGSAPTANTGISVWFLATQDGTNYEDGDGSVSGGSDVTPARAPDAVLPLRAVTTAQRVVRPVMLRWGKFAPLLKNDGTGQSLNSGATLKIRPVTSQGV
jgi:hypothetical protein